MAPKCAGNQDWKSLPPREQLASPECLAYLLSFAKKLTGNLHDAEDLCHDALAKTLQALNEGKYQARTGIPFLAYVFMIMRNHFLSEKRRSWRVATVEDFDLVANSVATPCSQEDATYLKQVLKVFGELSPEFQEAILAGTMRMPYVERAVEHGIAVGTAKSRYTRGVRALKNELGE